MARAHVAYRCRPRRHPPVHLQRDTPAQPLPRRFAPIAPPAPRVLCSARRQANGSEGFSAIGANPRADAGSPGGPSSSMTQYQPILR
ncbi:jg4547 [Pararge aegeria aegeria]|uniref:Jg4547 protein n=1 Tax=Pararge aegeria aegeria TaxID=348720 RepID=A0A8S4RTJ2_9NEOP|nr:jg4547 [Pararge aegeria aegeria]